MSVRVSRPRRYAPAILLLIAGALIGIWHNHCAASGSADIPVVAVRAVIAPPAAAIGRTTHWFGTELDALFAWRSEGAKIEALRRRVEQLQTENMELREAQIENL
ncbi:MAG TPA: hypothetical protein VGS41_04635, partial [Chthonomonadales bacterium]|nr:hypothetical protein [Chthonomonadales bacterium]